MNIPAWAVTVGLVVIIIAGAAWVYSRGTDKSDPSGSTEHVVSDAKGFFREYHLWGLLVIGFALSVWSVGHKQSEAVPGSSVDPFSGVLEIDAAGCQIIGPDGKSLKDSIREQSLAKGKALIPEGSTLNGDCFPSAKAARSTQSSSQ